MAGRFEPMAALAEALGTSLMPVRDARTRMIAERALVMHPSQKVAASWTRDARSNEPNSGR
jgi:DNA-binding GntR family transcriptional regulator